MRGGEPHRRPAPRHLRWLVTGALAALVLASVHQLAVATGLLGIGDRPGEGAPAEDGVVLVALGAMVLSGLVLPAVAPAGRVAQALLERPWVAALPVAAFAFVVVRWLSFDAYYAPSLIRRRDGAVVGAPWLLVLAALAAAPVPAAAVRHRIALVLAGIASLLCAVTVVLLGAGH